MESAIHIAGEEITGEETVSIMAITAVSMMAFMQTITMVELAEEAFIMAEEIYQIIQVLRELIEGVQTQMTP